MNYAAIFWLVLLVLFLMAESASVALISLWFAAGSLVAMIVSLAGGSIALQVVVFLAVSGILLALLRPLVRRYMTPKVTQTNVGAVIGKTGIVTAEIDNVAARGQVKLGAMEWTARSSDGTRIPVGTHIRADRVEGVKVFVSQVGETKSET